MWFIYISLCIGIIIGATTKANKKDKKVVDVLTLISVFALLFVMGINIGTNKEVINNLGNVGLLALIYSIFTIIGSIIVVYFLTQIIFRGIKK